jgi:site-specific DNA-cytosine methylase
VPGVKTILTLFSGGGLADVGAKAAGFQPVGAVEWDPAIAGVYRANHGDHVQVASVEEVGYRQYAGVDAVWASPCCTNASVANSEGKETEQDRSAARAVARCLAECRPPLFVLENVWGYREFDSFGLILRGLWELGYRFAFEHVNAADYGVPQTRRRLILRAWRREENVPMLVPTHCEGGRGGGLFDGEWGLLPWNGWYAAVEDLLPGCPESRLAEWQLKRLPERLETLLVHPSACNERFCASRSSEPSFTTVCGTNLPRAVLVDGQVLTVHGDPICREGTEPALGVFASANHGMPKAVLVPCTSTLDVRQGEDPSAAVMATVCAKAAMPRAVLIESKNANQQFGDGLRQPNEPATTVITDAKPSHQPKALLVGEQAGLKVDGQRQPQAAGAADPAFTIRAGENGGGYPKALLEGCRVVQLTPRCLARFQSVPDEYALPEKRSLACRVVGNGVPSLLAQRVLESFDV